MSHGDVEGESGREPDDLSHSPNALQIRSRKRRSAPHRHRQRNQGGTHAHLADRYLHPFPSSLFISFFPALKLLSLFYHAGGMNVDDVLNPSLCGVLFELLDTEAAVRCAVGPRAPGRVEFQLGHKGHC